jgi:hypothetical protein
LLALQRGQVNYATFTVPDGWVWVGLSEAREPQMGMKARCSQKD